MKKTFLLYFFIIASTLCSIAQNKTGILEVNSDPSGAKVYIDGIYVGKTPYSNPEINIGERKIKIFLNEKFPAFYKTIHINDIDPVVVNYSFNSYFKGVFSGVKEEIKIETKKGNVQIASIPTGAVVYLNSKNEGKAPLGYKKVGVGRYDIVFRLGDKKLKGCFDIYPDYTEKIIADFNKMEIRSQYQKELVEREEKLNRERLAANRAEIESLISNKIKQIKEDARCVYENNVGYAGLSDVFPKSTFDKYRENDYEITILNWERSKYDIKGTVYGANGERYDIKIKQYYKGYYKSRKLAKAKQNMEFKFILSINGEVLDTYEFFLPVGMCPWKYSQSELGKHYNKLQIDGFKIEAERKYSNSGYSGYNVIQVSFRKILPSDSELSRIVKQSL